MDLELEVRASIDRETLRSLAGRSDARGLLQLAFHAALLTATGTLVWASRGHLWRAAALVAHGIVLSFLFCPLHESIHRTAFARRWINEAVAWVCGALLMLPPRYFRAFHFAHHRFTQDPARDPELSTPPPASLGSYLWRISGLPYWGDRLRVTLRHALTGRVTEAFVPAGEAARIVREARMLWLCYLGLIGAALWERQAGALILYWLLPAFLGQPFLRLFLLAEHVDCPLTADMLHNTRTTVSNAAVRLLAWRMPYHCEHHCFPAVPFHALARLHALLGPRLGVSAPGYVAVHRALLRAFRAGRAPARLASH
jgi:fatty acid desaturase